MCMAFVQELMTNFSCKFSLFVLLSNNGLMMEEWMSIDIQTAKNLVKAIPRYLKVVVDAKGYPTNNNSTKNENIYENTFFFNV